jgi:hypothetical protein
MSPEERLSAYYSKKGVLLNSLSKSRLDNNNPDNRLKRNYDILYDLFTECDCLMDSLMG